MTRMYCAASQRSFAFQCLARSKARVVLIIGRLPAEAYMLYLKEHNINHDTVWQFGHQLNRFELPCAFTEWSNTNNGNTNNGSSSSRESEISRLAIVTFHLEAFGRARGFNITNIQRNIGFRERLIDYALVLLYYEVRLPGFLSTGVYFFQMSTGILIPVTAFEDFQPSNDTLSTYLSRPTLNTATMDILIKSRPSLLKKKRESYAFLGSRLTLNLRSLSHTGVDQMSFQCTGNTRQPIC
jgi:hypothetical protein